MLDTQRVYELGYLVMPTLSDERVAELVAELGAFITTHGGEHIASGDPERIDLAYTMIKVIDNKNIRVSEAYFGWLKFTLDPAELAALRSMLDAHNDLIRYLLFKTVTENTFIARKNPRRRMRTEEGIDTESDAIIDAVESEPIEALTDEATTEAEPTESEILDTKIESLIPDTDQM